MKGLRRVQNKAGTTWDFMRARKLAYYGHIMRKQRNLPGERDCARKNAWYMQKRTTYGLDKLQHMDQTYCGGISQNDK